MHADKSGRPLGSMYLCLRVGRLELACDARGVTTKVLGVRSGSVWLAAAACLRGGELELLLGSPN